MRYRITLDFETKGQLATAMSVVRAIGPDRFRLRVKVGKRVVWREDGRLFDRPEPNQ
jgi:hypothetical protein